MRTQVLNFNKIIKISAKLNSHRKSITATEIETPPNTRLQESTKYQISFYDIEVEKQLGGGSYGTVYLGRWNNAPVALKFCKKQTQINEFLKEAQLMMYAIRRISNQLELNLVRNQLWNVCTEICLRIRISFKCTEFQLMDNNQ
jgi:predicted Ser/Thr protein kinase